jgi:D-glycero-alpha-D-manno-heptose-7-phosphate kinase
LIITRTPFRISLFGGGTDYPQWFHEHAGAVIGTAINRYCYISLRRLPPFFEYKHRIVYSKIELAAGNDDIVHPAVRAVFQDKGVDEGLELHHNGDLPALSGLGSSSSFTVGLLNSYHALHGQMISKSDLAKEAIRIEQNVIKENVGSQDQIWAAYGGFNRIDFNRDGSFGVRPMILSNDKRDQIRASFVVCFTGLSRFSSDVAKSTLENMGSRSANLFAMRGMVDEATNLMEKPELSIQALGELLHESWKLKRGLSDSVSNPEIDEIYEAARGAGAIGGKVLGAGGGGFMLFIVKPEHKKAVEETLSKLVQVEFDFDTTGSQVVVYEPDEF